METKNAYGISALAPGNLATPRNATIEVYGTIESANPCILGYGGTGNYANMNLTMKVYDGAVIKQNSLPTWIGTSWDDGTESDKDCVAIYQPNDGTLEITGGTITSVLLILMLQVT